MMRVLSLKTCKRLVWLLCCAALVLVIFAPTALAAERYQILKLGDKDDYVRALQTRLKELGYFTGTVTGYFGTKTQQAVIDYQQAHSLFTDGKAGPETLSALMGGDFVISRDQRGFSPGSADYPAPGDRGSAVADVQQRLKELEYYDYPVITGYYGPVTEKAVRLFQNINGLKLDGIAGPETMKLLGSDSAKAYCVSFGDRGDDVKKLQTRLIALGYLNGSATGYFGTKTLDAVKEFQAQSGLFIDAKAGRETRARLFSSSARRWDNIDRVADESGAVETASSPDTVIDFANSLIGKPYMYAAEGPVAFDSSGFVYYVLRYCGVSAKRCNPDGLSKIESWTKISDSSALVPGDILFFQSGASARINHAGIYLGDNRFIHASSSQSCVTVSSLSDDYGRSFRFARRIF